MLQDHEPTPLDTTDARDPDRFAVVADAQMLKVAQRVAAAGAVLSVALAPYDLVYARQYEEAARALLVMRVIVVVLCLVFLAGVRRARPGAMNLWAVMWPFLAACAVVGGAMGVTARSDHAWFMALQLLPVASSVLLVPLVQRGRFIAVSIAAALAGFAVMFRGALSTSYVVHAVGLLCVSGAFAMHGGHELYRQTAEAWRLRRALDRKGRELEELNATLERKVAERTRELEELAARIDDVLETERRRMASELHDDLGQELTTLRIELETLRFQTRDPAVVEGVVRAAGAVDRAHHGVRRMLESLRARVLDDEGLDAAVHWLAAQFRARTGLRCDATVTLDGDPLEPVGLGVFRIVQEALAQVARRGDATRVEITLHDDGEALTLCVRDNGRGAYDNATARSGLVGMRERAIALRGTLTVTAEPGRGTAVEATIPHRRDEVADDEETIG